MTIAHELDHALEDQAIGLDEDAGGPAATPASPTRRSSRDARRAVMFDYLDRHFKSDVALGGLLGGSFAAAGTGDLPPFIVAELHVPVRRGQQFVAELLRRAGGRWTLVDLAERTRPPASTEQILHPEKWIAVEVPERGAPAGLGRRLGAGYERLAAGAFGEWQTGQLLALGGGAAARGRGGLGRRPLRALAPRRDGPCDDALRRPRRARAALALGHRARRRGVRRGAARDAARGGLDGEPAGTGPLARRDGGRAALEPGPRRRRSCSRPTRRPPTGSSADGWA